jgi:hypothetical protein
VTRLAAAFAVCLLAEAGCAGVLAGVDPIVAATDLRLEVALGWALLVPLRVAVWFVLPGLLVGSAVARARHVCDGKRLLRPERSRDG